MVKIEHTGFHGFSSLTLRLAGKPGDVVTLSSGQAQRLRTAACGMEDCACGESMIGACLDGHPDKPLRLRIPTEAEAIELVGKYA